MGPFLFRSGIKSVAFAMVLFLTACAGNRNQSASTDMPYKLAADAPARSGLFDDGWKFSKGDASGAQAVEFSDSSWRNVTLPHDWSVEGPFDESAASCQAYLPGGIGWYRKTFVAPASWKNRRISIQFDGVYKNSDVWCNGTLLGKRPSGYASFEYDLTPHLNFGGKNVLAVRVDHSDVADSRWYSGSGIDRNVFLIVTGPLHVAANGTFVTTPKVTPASADIAIESTIANDDEVEHVFVLENIVKNAKGEKVGSEQVQGSVPPHSANPVNQSITVANPSLWSPQSPAMYEVDTLVKVGDTVVDEYHTPIGIRHIDFDPNRGLLINGVSVKMKGVCIHGDAGALGSAVPVEVWERRLKELQECGCNAIRTSHNPPDPRFLDLCDRMGFLVMDEAFDEWSRGKKKWTNGHNNGQFSTIGYWSDFDQWSQIDLHDMVVRDRNHPSVIMWSIGNEIDFPDDPYPLNSPELPPIAARLIKTVKSLDTSRPVTAACAAIASNLFADQLDVVGYNYQENRYAQDHAQFPNRFIFGSENKHDAPAWRAVADNDFISGQFLWTGIDYLGEARGWPVRTAEFGLLDLAGFKKPEFYFRQSLWTDAPMVFINPTPRGLICYSNCTSVELFQDDQSLGEKSVGDDHTVRWTASFTHGVLKAVGKKDGGAAATWQIQSAGDPAKLVIQSERQDLSAATRGVAQIEVQIADTNGNRALDAANLVHCALTGPGRILGIESGDPANDDAYSTDHEKAYQGRMMVYIQSTGAPGEITLSTSSDGLAGAGTKITAQ